VALRYVLAKQGGLWFRSTEHRIVRVKSTVYDVDGLYEILGVSTDASWEEIVHAGHKRMIESHPDYGGDEEEFIKVREAYKILSRPSKRAEYDSKRPSLTFNIITQDTGQSRLEATTAMHSHNYSAFYKPPSLILNQEDVDRLSLQEKSLFFHAYNNKVSVIIRIGITEEELHYFRVINGAFLIPLTYIRNQKIPDYLISFAVLSLLIEQTTEIGLKETNENRKERL